MANQSGPMACPVDGATLVMSERAGIEIDYCPTCRGVWLDRGELDKIIERAATDAAPQQAQPSQQPPYPNSPQQQQQQPFGYSGQHGGHRPRRRKSFLEDLFD